MRRSGACAAHRCWRWGNTTQWKGWRRTSEPGEVSAAPSPMDLGGRSVQSVAAGSHHSAYIDGAGDVYTFGSQTNQQLGHDGDGETPQKVDLPEPCVTVALGGHHSAAIGSSGNLYTWGWTGSFWSGCGGLGHADTSASAPRVVEKLATLGEKITQVSCGAQHTLVIAESGNVYAWGKGEYGRLGQGDTQDSQEPEEVDFFRDLQEGPTPQRVVSISAGAQWSSAQMDSGLLYVWGRNDQGQLGLGEESMGDLYSSERYPRVVGILAQENLKMNMQECGDSHIVAMCVNGALYSWGSRTWLEPRALTVPAGYEKSLPSVRALGAGLDFSYVLTEQGGLYVLGKKGSGCLGEREAATARVPRMLPPKLFGNEKVLDIQCGSTRCMAITDSDTLVATSEAEQEELQKSNPNATVELLTIVSLE